MVSKNCVNLLSNHKLKLKLKYFDQFFPIQLSPSLYPAWAVYLFIYALSPPPPPKKKNIFFVAKNMINMFFFAIFYFFPGHGQTFSKQIPLHNKNALTENLAQKHALKRQ